MLSSMADMRHSLAALLLVASLSSCTDEPGARPSPQQESSGSAAPYPQVPTTEATPAESQGKSPTAERRYASAFAVGEDLEVCETWYPRDPIAGIETVGCEENGETIRVTWFATDAERARYESAPKPGAAAVLLADEFAVACSPADRCDQLAKQGIGSLLG
jgi:hypothetical protein